MKTLENKNVKVDYDPSANGIDIFLIQDKKDYYNQPMAYNETKRGHEKAYLNLDKKFTDKTTFEDVLDILRKNKIRMHRWCSID